MWMAGGVDEDEQLDRDAAVNVLRRTYGFLRPYRGRLILAAVFALLYTASTLAGPLLVRTGIDDGIKEGTATCSTGSSSPTSSSPPSATSSTGARCWPSPASARTS